MSVGPLGGQYDADGRVQQPSNTRPSAGGRLNRTYTSERVDEVDDLDQGDAEGRGDGGERGGEAKGRGSGGSGGGGHGAVYSPRGRHSQTWFDDMGIDAETQP